MAVASKLRAQQLRTVILSLDDLQDLQDALDTLANGGTLTAGESGVNAVASIANATLVGQPQFVFDGFKYTVAFFLTSG